MKLAQRYYLDPAIRGVEGDLGDAAEVMFTRGIARAGEVGQRGFIPEQDVELLTRRRRYAAVVKVLTDSGLWHAVPGGYQVRRWADWQEHLDALTRKRTADRDRQRRRRAAAQNGASTTSQDRHPPPLSRDTSRDVTAVEGEGDLEGVKGGDTGTAPRARDAPSLGCKKHPQGTDDPCGPCAGARKRRQQWEDEQAQASADADRRAREAPKCDMCTKPLNSTYHRRFCDRSAP